MTIVPEQSTTSASPAEMFGRDVGDHLSVDQDVGLLEVAHLRVEAEHDAAPQQDAAPAAVADEVLEVRPVSPSAARRAAAGQRKRRRAPPPWPSGTRDETGGSGRRCRPRAQTHRLGHRLLDLDTTDSSTWSASTTQKNDGQASLKGEQHAGNCARQSNGVTGSVKDNGRSRMDDLACSQDTFSGGGRAAPSAAGRSIGAIVYSGSR